MSVRFAIPSMQPTATNLECHMTARNRPAGPRSVLFIGNSFTAHNDLPGLIATLAAARGKEFRHRLISAGGASLRTHWNAGEAVNAIRSGTYDAVIGRVGRYRLVAPILGAPPKSPPDGGERRLGMRSTEWNPWSLTRSPCRKTWDCNSGNTLPTLLSR